MKLQHITLSHWRLGCLSYHIGDLVKFHYLNISGTYIKIPCNIVSLKRIIYIDLRNSEIESLLHTIGALTMLQKLHYHGQSIDPSG